MIKLIDGRGKDASWLEARLKKRLQLSHDDKKKTVQEIIERVKSAGDEAVLEYTRKFDGASFNTPEDLLVDETEIEQAYKSTDPHLIEIIRAAKERIWNFHSRQRRNTWIDFQQDGVILGQKIQALEKVGVYVPGGRAAYPSSVLMNVIPAKVAGVEQIFMVTPPGSEGKVSEITLVAAKEAGVDAIFKVGGAQAIAALAFGTDTIPKVDKIVGPGNIYVALAKKEVYGYVDIDMIAGPSEIMVIADESAQPAFVAADLMSQAEHDPMACAILATPSLELAKRVIEQIKKQISNLATQDTIRLSFENYGAAIVVDTLDEAIDLANMIAPEHLELAVEKPFEWLGEVRNAGAVFLGHFSPEPVGDYMAGPNHVLPTSGTARFFSPLGVDDFVKKTSIIHYTARALEKVYRDVSYFARAEGLVAHANSVEVRFCKK